MKLSLHPSNEWMQSNNTTDNENAWIQLYERNYGQPWHWCPSTSRSPRFLFPCERVPFIYLAGVPRALRRNAALSINIPDWPPKFQDSLPLKMTQFDEFPPSFNLATKGDYNVTYIFLSAQIKEIARLRNFHRKRIILICLKSKNDNMTARAPLLYQIKEFKRFGENNERSYLWVARFLFETIKQTYYIV